MLGVPRHRHGAVLLPSRAPVVGLRSIRPGPAIGSRGERRRFIDTTRWVSVLASVVALGCDRPADDLERRVLEELGAPHGALLVFEPSTCAVDAGFFAGLNALDARPAAKVVGLVAGTDSSLTSMRAIAGDFGISFTLRPLHPELRSLLGGLARAGFPVLIVVRRGRLRAIEFLGGSRASDLRYVLAAGSEAPADR